MRICYFDCFAGAAGDMILGALLDAGVPSSVVEDAVGELNLTGWSLSVHDTDKGGLRATRAVVHSQEGDVDRSLADIEEVLTSSNLSESVRSLAVSAFRTLGQAEARVHGVDVSAIHFHELGALDAIVDIVGSCAAFDHLDPRHTTVSPLPLGSGTVEAAHGLLPVPVPAVSEILAQAKVPVGPGGTGETITPTGAALLVTFADSFGAPPPMRLEATGYGAGKRDTDLPNVVRLLVGQADPSTDFDAPRSPEAFVLETNLDDMSPELIAHACERLLEIGASDAWTTPITMKKGRSAVTLSVLVSPEIRDGVLDVLFAETSTLGVRMVPVAKEMLERDFVTVEVGGQVIRVKLGIRKGHVVNRAPEYEDARVAARELGLPLKEVYQLAIEQARILRPQS
ncbi:MAG TPA: nickel pincer cofactor biosynthesis protein LarC [Actinomycetota bacterium]|nr:nickel pincer cofactor biosynthesis protein LarC [Actinomycetota bacterium]